MESSAIVTEVDSDVEVAVEPRIGIRINPGFTFPVNVFFASSTLRAKLGFQADGNLVVKDENNRPRWSSNTARRGARCIFQRDGNLVVYGGDGKPLWASNTAGNPDCRLIVQDDGNVVIYSSAGKALWATGTNH